MSGRRSRGGRHRRPSARPAAIVTFGAGALLLSAAMPAGSVVDATLASGSSPMPTSGTQSASVPQQAVAVEDALGLVNAVLGRLSDDPGAALDDAKGALADLRERADATGVAQDVSGAGKRLAERNAQSLELLLEETARQIGAGGQEILTRLEDGLGGLRDDLEWFGSGSVDLQAFEVRIAEILHGAVGS